MEESKKEKKRLKNKNIFEALKNAFKGLEYSIRTEKNIKWEIVLTIFALLLGIVFKLTRTEIIILVFTIVFVIFAEMINTAIENVVDLFVDVYHPKAKIAKDVAAGAVIVSTFNAAIVSYFIFFEKLAVYGGKFLRKITTRRDLAFILLAFLFCILLIIIKMITKANKKMRISATSMVGFAIFTAIWITTTSKEILFLSLISAIMLASSQIISRRKNIFEVLFGGVIGVILTIMLMSLI